jgi:phosphoribosylamine--glycine ligase
MMRLQSDLITLCQNAIDKKLDTTIAQWDSRAAIGVVLAAGGYPEDYQKGAIISGLDSVNSQSSKVFHAGTTIETNNEQEHILTNGGRVLCLVALGDSVSQAQQQVYQKIDNIHFNNVFYRTDIGYRAIARENRKL